MIVRIAAPLLLLALSGMSIAASAQLSSSAEAGVFGTTGNGSDRRTASAIVHALRFDHARFALDVRGSLAGERSDRWRAGIFGALALSSPARAGFQAIVTGERSPDTMRGSDASAASAHTMLGGRLSWSHGTWGLWAGRDLPVANRAVPFPTPYGRVGGWRQFGRLVLTLDVGTVEVPRQSDAASPPEPPFPTDSLPFMTLLVGGPDESDSLRLPRSWTNAETQAHWSFGRVAVQGTLGMHLAARQARGAAWGSIAGSVELTPRAAIVAGAGSRPAGATLGAPPLRFFNLGLRVATGAPPSPRLPVGVRPTAAAFALRAIDERLFSIRVHAPGARTLELSADFTQWRPVSLTRASGDLWEVRLPIARGTHRVAIRIDGERWIAPPGTTAVRDDFGGMVGVITAP
jgi:hypothetical protein